MENISPVQIFVWMAALCPDQSLRPYADPDRRQAVSNRGSLYPQTRPGTLSDRILNPGGKGEAGDRLGYLLAVSGIDPDGRSPGPVLQGGGHTVG